MLARIVLIPWPHDPLSLASQSAGIIGVSHRAQPEFILIDGIVHKIMAEFNDHLSYHKIFAYNV